MEKIAPPQKDDDYVDVSNPAARRFISDGSNGIFLTTFVGKETTLAASALFHKISKPRMSYWIRKMLDLQLIKIARYERAANGVQQAVYTSSAHRYRIKKSALTKSEWRETYALLTRHVWGRVIDSVMHAMRESPGDALRLFRYKATNVCWRLIGKDEDTSARDGYLLTWGRVRLKAEDYRAMQRDLSAVVERYNAKTVPNGACIWYVIAANEEPPEPPKL